MTENTTPTPADFNLEDWLVGGTEHRPTRSVEVYLNQHLRARIDEVERRMRLADAGASNAAGEAEERLGAVSASSLGQEREQLLAEIQKAKATVTVYALIDDEIDAVNKALNEGAEDEDAVAQESVAWWYAVIAEAGTLSGNKLTAEQWKRVHQTIGVQFASIVNAYHQAARYERVPSAPFSPPASQRVTGQ